jgi:Tfp pilus assembly protein PilV
MQKKPTRTAAKQGFTLVEVMMAAFVLIAMFCTALAAIFQGFSLLDTARNITLAGQIGQSTIEDLRLQPWSKIVTYPTTATIDLTQTIGIDLSQTEASAIAQRFTATRTIVDVPDRASDLKRATITITWADTNQLSHSRSYETLLGHFGLTDYFVATHSTP